jgi:uncharacterized membrane protein YgcG
MSTLIMSSLVAAAISYLPLPDSTSTATAEKPEYSNGVSIVDRADFFSTDAKKQALQTIRQLRRDKQVEVRVETYEELPPEKAAEVRGMSARERAVFFQQWLKELAKREQANGVFILICKEPSHLRVGISTELHRRGFTDDERDAISERLLNGFREKDYDKGLLDAIAYIDTAAGRASSAKSGASSPVPTRSEPRADQSRPGTRRESSGIGAGLGGLICLGVVGFIVVMVVMMVARMFRRSPAAGGYGQPMQGPQGYGGYQGGYGGPMGGGGGGMFGGLMSGIGGALLGNYMYDRWNQPTGHSGHQPPDAGSTAAGGQMMDDPNRYEDFSSSGGDFGDSGGGGFGGGDSGGGDYGGGDSGGDGGGDF